MFNVISFPDVFFLNVLILNLVSATRGTTKDRQQSTTVNRFVGSERAL